LPTLLGVHGGERDPMILQHRLQPIADDAHDLSLPQRLALDRSIERRPLRPCADPSAYHDATPRCARLQRRREFGRRNTCWRAPRLGRRGGCGPPPTTQAPPRAGSVSFDRECAASSQACATTTSGSKSRGDDEGQRGRSNQMDDQPQSQPRGEHPSRDG
jgi:hypothetical protein